MASKNIREFGVRNNFLFSTSFFFSKCMNGSQRTIVMFFLKFKVFFVSGMWFRLGLVCGKWLTFGCRTNQRSYLLVTF